MLIIMYVHVGMYSYTHMRILIFYLFCKSRKWYTTLFFFQFFSYIQPHVFLATRLNIVHERAEDVCTCISIISNATRWRDCWTDWSFHRDGCSRIQAIRARQAPCSKQQSWCSQLSSHVTDSCHQSCIYDVDAMTRSSAIGRNSDVISSVAWFYFYFFFFILVRLFVYKCLLSYTCMILFKTWIYRLCIICMIQSRFLPSTTAVLTALFTKSCTRVNTSTYL